MPVKKKTSRKSKSATVKKTKKFAKIKTQSLEQINFKKMFDNSADGIVLADPKTKKFVLVNKAVCKMLGYSETEFKKLGVKDIHPKESLKDVQKSFLKQLRKEGSLSRDLPVKRKNGTIFYADINSFPITLGGKKYLMGNFRDITDRKQVQDDLQKSQELFKQVEKNANEWIWEIDAKGKYTYVSSAIERVVGYKPREIVGKKYFYSLFHAKERESLKKAAFKMFSKKLPFKNFQNRIVHKNGKDIWFLTSGIPILDKNKKLIGYRGVDIDVSEQKRIEDELRHSEKQYETLYNSSVDAIMTLIPKGKFIGGNPATIKMFKCENERGFVRLSPGRLSPKKQPDGQLSLVKSQKMIKMALEKGSHFFEWKHKRANGEAFDAVVLLTKMKLEGKDVLQATVRDITLQKEAEEVMKRLAAIVSFSDDAIVGINLQGKITSWNKGAQKIYKFKEKDVLGKSISIIAPENKEQEIRGILRKIKKGIAIEHLETVRKKKDGSLIDVSLTISPVYNSNNEVIGASTIARDITKQKRVTDELQYAINFNSTLLDAIPFGMDIVNEHGTILFANKLLTDALGKNLIGKRCWEAYSDDVVQCIDCPLKEKIKIGEVKVIQTKKCLGGRSLQITHTGMLYEGKEAVLEIFQDITEKEQAEEKLLEFSRAVEQGPSIVVITDLDGNIEYVNPKFTEVTGYSSEEAVGQNPRILKSAETHSSIYKELWGSIKAGKEWHGEFLNKRKNGELYWESASISPVKNSLGEVVRYMAIKEDVTAKKAANKELARLASYPELDPNPIFEMSVDGEVTYCNPAARILFPSLVEDGVVHPILKNYKIIQSKILESEQKYLTDAVSIGDRDYETHISYVIQEQKMRFYMTDITERKRIEKLKDEFVSTVSHELRTPLSITKEGISLVLDRIPGDLNEKQEKILDTSKSNIDRLARIINDLLDISKIESGKVELVKTVINFNDLVAEAMKSFALKAKEKGIVLKESINAKPLFVKGDRDKVAQILFNLIDNSIKFTESGSITITAEPLGSKLKCSIEDTGIGISSGVLTNIFDKFKQFGRVDGPGGKGTGLGLSIIKGIVEMHGGMVWAESKLGIGAKFSFILPGLRSDMRDESLGPKDIKVLIADDESSMVEILSSRFEMNGYEVIAAHDGKEALEKTKSEKPNIVLMDVMMPKINGYEVCKLIKSDNDLKETFVILFTVKSGEKDKEMGMAVGADDYVIKPFDSVHLMEKIDKLINKLDETP